MKKVAPHAVANLLGVVGIGLFLAAPSLAYAELIQKRIWNWENLEVVSQQGLIQMTEAVYGSRICGFGACPDRQLNSAQSLPLAPVAAIIC